MKKDDEEFTIEICKLPGEENFGPDDYVYIPESLMMDRSFSAVNKMFYAALLCMVDKDLILKKTVDEVKAEIDKTNLEKMSYKKVLKYLNKLVFHGYIKKIGEDEYLLVANLDQPRNKE